ncbi:MAG: PTS sugar transporter subunit IIC [Erysipelotrichaceae bacterium]|nr:PTS sugar transporter subunit IIC [Erysipelotrichaceae bacterium]
MNIFQRCLGYLTAFCNLKPIVVLKEGFILTTPATLVGSLFLLIANFPVDGYNEFMTSFLGAGWADPLNQVSGATFDILAIIVVLAIAYKFATLENVDGISCAILALVSFLIVTASSVTAQTGEVIGGVIPKTWVGGNGIITAILMGLLTSYIFCFFIKRKIIIKMPDSVPEGVSKAFAALLPGLVIFTLSAVIFVLCKTFGEGLTFTELIFKVLQTPLQAFAGSLPGVIILTLITNLLFWCGIHGPNIVGGIMTPLWTASALANQSILDKGEKLIVGENAEIFTVQFDYFIKIGGCGMTLGLLIAALLTARSQRLKSITRLSVVPGIFNINEPVIFGLPIVFNAYFLIPFLFAPVVAVLIYYGAVITGFLPPFGAVQIPWTTPPIISGFLVAGFQGVVVQLVIIVAIVLLYFPFMKIQDRLYVQQENGENGGSDRKDIDDEDLETLAAGL